MRPGPFLRRVSLAVAAPVALYFAAALTGSVLPRNPGWKEAPEGVTIYVATNGYHTGLLLPAAEAGIDWSGLAEPRDLPDPGAYGRWLLFGWGDRDFYLNTPSWAEFSPRTALLALVGSGHTLVHVDHLDAPGELADIRAVRLSPAEYRRLAHYVAGSFDGPHRPIPGYTDRDVFYPGRGRYSLFTTCNSWTADALAAAGVRVALWTPFSGGVMRWF